MARSKEGMAAEAGSWLTSFLSTANKGDEREEEKTEKEVSMLKACLQGGISSSKSPPPKLSQTGDKVFYYMIPLNHRRTLVPLPIEKYKKQAVLWLHFYHCSANMHDTAV